MKRRACSAARGSLIIISGADSGYFPLLRDTVLSVRALAPHVAIGILDVGLGPDQREWLKTQVTHIERPGWDIQFPGMNRLSEARKAQVSRPFLPRHFPGYEMYLWVDADAWVQDWRAIDLYCAAAARDKLAITPEIDRAYKRHYKRPKWFGLTLAWKSYREGFGWRVADRLGRNPILNSGVFALHAEAPHWQAWQETLASVLQRSSFFLGEQTALNYLVFALGLPANLLPAYCNWMPGDAAPAFDPVHGLFVEPYAPHEVIGVMHLAGSEQKTQRFRLARLGGGTVETGLRYADTRDLSVAPAAAGI